MASNWEEGVHHQTARSRQQPASNCSPEPTLLVIIIIIIVIITIIITIIIIINYDCFY